MNSSTKIDNRKKYILILGKDPAQGLEHFRNSNVEIRTSLMVETLVLIVKSLFFFSFVLKQLNVAVVVTISIIHMQNCVFLML